MMHVVEVASKIFVCADRRLIARICCLQMIVCCFFKETIEQTMIIKMILAMYEEGTGQLSSPSKRSIFVWDEL